MATRALGRALSYLDETSIRRGAETLAAADPRLALLFETNGLPPLWGRDPGFATLVKMVLEQQVSLDSAAAAFANLESELNTVDPSGFLTLDDAQLKTIGFSHQKTGYCRGIASGILDGSIDLDELDSLDDETAHERLTAIRGIGPWTADVYLLFALRRPDVWPTGDRALVVSMAETLPLDEVPSYPEADEMAEAWRPWRSVAARMLWHSYLFKRGRSLD